MFRLHLLHWLFSACQAGYFKHSRSHSESYTPSAAQTTSCDNSLLCYETGPWSSAVRRYALNESVIRQAQSITQLLVKWGSGDKAALDELIPPVYDELRKLAASYLRRRSGSNTLQATALVHEAYVRLADQSSISMEHRAQFFGLAAKIMRDILVDQARKRLSAKRGGQQLQLSLTAAERFGSKPEVELIALDDALKQFATTNPQHSRIIELRFFGGLTIEETANVMNLSHATTER